jgi:uncharacterized protein involved in cysteine biosynthesis
MAVKERSWTSILINRPFQLKLLSYFVVLFVLTTISLYSTTFLFFWNMKNKGLSVGIPEGHVYYQFLNNQKHDLDLLFVGLAAFNLVLLLTVGFVVSHRIAGPIHKVKLFLKDPKSQEPVQMRQNDFFKELGPLVNEIKNKIP